MKRGWWVGGMGGVRRVGEIWDVKGGQAGWVVGGVFGGGWDVNAGGGCVVLGGWIWE